MYTVHTAHTSNKANERHVFEVRTVKSAVRSSHTFNSTQFLFTRQNIDI